MPQLNCSLDPANLGTNMLPEFQLTLTPKEIARLDFALNHVIDSFGDVLPDAELARYEDLMYRLAGLSDSTLKSYVEGRRHDVQDR